MPHLVTLESLTLSVGASLLLDSVSAHLAEGQRIALVGPNGSGKSTLLRALAAPDDSKYFLIGAGKVGGSLRPDARPAGSVLLVEQDVLQWAELLPDAGCDEDELREMTLPDALDLAAAAGGDAAQEDVEAWRRLSIAADRDLEWRTAQYRTRALGQLSPGCALRAYLAVALARHDVQLLLLDEPTNHLDLPSVIWLQEAIIASGKAVVIVSHDEAFLDAVADHVWDIDRTMHKLTASGAKYSAFLHAKEVAVEQQKAAYGAQQERRARLTAVADKLRASSTAGQRHMGTDNDKMQRDFRRDRAGRSGRKAKAIETLRDAEPTVERVVERAPLEIRLVPLKAGSDASLILGDARLGYDGEPLPLPPVTLRVDFGERIAIVGYNGVGKSTLLKTLTRAIPPVDGDVSIGRELRFGNLTQEHETLPRDTSLREHISRLTGLPEFETGQRLIQYGLARQQVDRPVCELNAGARARALLATFALQSVNALILDEPTNHLDAEAVAEVIATLRSFGGTVVIVSHNRAFLDAVELTRTVLLSSDGVCEIESMDAFVETTEEAVRAVVAAAFQ